MQLEKTDKKPKVVLFGKREEVSGLTPQEFHKRLSEKMREAMANTSENLAIASKHLENCQPRVAFL